MPVCTKVRPPSRLVSKVWAKYKDVPTKILKRDVTQVNKNEKFVFEQCRQTSQRMMNVRKQQFGSFEVSGEEKSFQIMSFCFQF